jgi:hypothetical protein
MRTRSAALCLAVLLSGCGSVQRSTVDEQWGRSYGATRAAQVADPNAPTDDAAIEGMDPKSGEAVAERYYTGQRTQETRRAPAITISGD